jgi:hypothetical protein
MDAYFEYTYLTYELVKNVSRIVRQYPLTSGKR